MAQRLSSIFIWLCLFLLQIMICSTIPRSLAKIPLAKGYFSSFIDEVTKSSNTVKRALNIDFKNNLTTEEAFTNEHLQTTNELRAKHGVPALELDYKLCKDAEDYAKILADKSRTANKITVEHSGKYNTGENILGGQNNTKITGKFCADRWYSEIAHHDWVENVFSPKTGHFTQLIWKDTTQIGVGRVHLPSTDPATMKPIVIVVARYMPQGNWAYKSSFKVNVLPPITAG